jgi:PAS domain S-box-containing protein
MHTNLPDLGDLLSVVFNSAAEGLVVCDSRGVIQLVNPRVGEMFGMESASLLGQTIEVLLPDRLKEMHVKHRESYMQAPKQRSMGTGMRLMAKRSDGTEFPVEAGLNHFEKDGQRYVIALLTDISGRAKMEDQLREVNLTLEELVRERTKKLQESQLLYSAIARNFPKGTINVFDKDLNYVFVEGEDLYKAGVTGDKLVGTNYLNHLPEHIVPVIKRNLGEVFSGKKTSFEVNIPKGSYQLNCVPLPSPDGSIERILVVELNVSILKEAEEKAKAALVKERELSELKSKFVSLASHEFRTPLSTVLSGAGLIDRYADLGQVDKIKQHASRIKDNVKALTGILNDFLSLGKLEEGHVKPQAHEINIKDLFAGVADEMREIAKPGQTIEYYHNGSELAMTDAQVVRNISINLISNAIKYSPEGCPITLSCQIDKDSISFQVTDMGIGIPEQDQNKLFERFFRAKNASNIQGTGLGLNIVKRYVDIMNGQITFESTLGRGSTFSVVIPQMKNNEQDNSID